jgi:uncharacterized protein (TIGR02996 family)
MAQSSSLDGAPVSPEVRSFFRAIKEQPDNDTPRLIFADWLQERGDAASAARGEYLRLSVLRHRLAPDDPNYEVLKRREAELFTEHRWTWLGPLKDAARGWGFERGMLQITALGSILLDPEVTSWARTEAALWIDALTLTRIWDDFYGRADSDPTSFACSPLLAHLNRLDLSNLRMRRYTQLGFRFLFRSLRARNLRLLTELVLSHNVLTNAQIHALAFSSHFPRLRSLDLQHNRLEDDSARILAESPYLKNGVTLLLGGNRFTPEGVALLRRTFCERVHF